MTETKFTPGPWRWDKCSVTRQRLTSASGDIGVSARRVDGWNIKERPEATYALIGAAPELYAALDQLRAIIRPNPHSEREYLMLPVDLMRVLPLCDAALAKARGEL